MGNRDTATAREYHEATKHSYASIRTDLHFLDWQNKPLEFKVYPDLPPIPLPRDFPHPTAPTLRAIAGGGPWGAAAPLDLPTLASLLFFAGGLTKKAVLRSGEAFYFRAAACAGALYPIELYVVAGPLAGLEPGVYHFSPLDFALRPLRAGDVRANLAAAAGDEALGAAPAAIVATAITWRSAWKYRARSYRYHFWDAGTILANLLATAAAGGEPASVVLGFADGEVNGLLGVDGDREVALALVPVGGAGPPPPPAIPLGPLAPRVEPLSRREARYPIIAEMHGASSLASGAEARAWRGSLERPPPPEAPGPAFPLPPAPGEGQALGEVILRRGSTRFFARDPIPLAHLGAILGAATSGFRADFLGEGGASLVDTYLIANAVEGVPPGAYFYAPGRRRLEGIRQGKFRAEAGYLCLEQELGADAAATIFFLADLGAVLDRFGNRGYRAAQLEAGIVGGRVYLAAYALGLGATGLTFYDDDVVDFFSPHAQGKDALFVVAVGRAARGRVSRVQPLPLAAPRPSAPGSCRR